MSNNKKESKINGEKKFSNARNSICFDDKEAKKIKKEKMKAAEGRMRMQRRASTGSGGPMDIATAATKAAAVAEAEAASANTPLSPKRPNPKKRAARRSSIGTTTVPVEAPTPTRRTPRRSSMAGSVPVSQAPNSSKSLKAPVSAKSLGAPASAKSLGAPTSAKSLGGSPNSPKKVEKVDASKSPRKSRRASIAGPVEVETAKKTTKPKSHAGNADGDAPAPGKRTPRRSSIGGPATMETQHSGTPATKRMPRRSSIGAVPAAETSTPVASTGRRTPRRSSIGATVTAETPSAGKRAPRRSSIAGTADIKNKKPNKSKSLKGCRATKDSSSSSSSTNKGVSFSTLKFHEHPMVLGHNPSTSEGPPVEIDWKPQKSYVIKLERYEATRPDRKYDENLLIPCEKREDMLISAGYTMDEINEHMDQLALEEYEYYKSKSLTSKITKLPKLVGKTTGRSIRWMLYG